MCCCKEISLKILINQIVYVYYRSPGNKLKYPAACLKKDAPLRPPTSWSHHAISIFLQFDMEKSRLVILVAPDDKGHMMNKTPSDFSNRHPLIVAHPSLRKGVGCNFSVLICHSG